jgi:predicted ATPase
MTELTANSAVSLLELDNGKQLLTRLGKINIIIGKNGCGKSTALKALEARWGGPALSAIPIRYITPERAGVLLYAPHVDGNISQNPDWLRVTRRTNQFEHFKQQTMVLYRKLEMVVLRSIEINRAAKEDFNSVVAQINSLLDNVKLVRDTETFSIQNKEDGAKIEAQNISSGESELIALAIEAATFAWECKGKELGWLLLDEPDVHLHPDLQSRLAQMLLKLAKESGMRIIISTHSTALLAALAGDPGSRVAFMMKKGQSLDFREISEGLQAVLPVFGAHPLSAVFNQKKLLIVEGEDDERLWQRTFRSSQGKVNVYPVAAGSIDQLNKLEREAADVLGSVYESAKAYSIRDRDDSAEGNPEDLGPVRRFRLRCRTAENLLLADDTLALLKTDWEAVRAKLDDWITRNPSHPHGPAMLKFQQAGYPRVDFNLKEIRNDLLGVLGTNKSWEDAIGVAIAQLKPVASAAPADSLQAYLGDELSRAIAS